ncbi:MAG: hypothetical protein RJA36_3554 [Pseudomonadota bacterium]|jgi:phospholipase/carboxylesterase
MAFAEQAPQRRQAQDAERERRIDAQQAEHSHQALVPLLAALQRQHGVAAQQTVVAGFSQGGIMSAGVALTSPESVAGFGLLSGRILPEEIAPLLASRERLGRLQGFVAHGELDSKLPVDWAQRAHAWLDEPGVDHALKLYPIDHSISAPTSWPGGRPWAEGREARAGYLRMT